MNLRMKPSFLMIASALLLTSCGLFESGEYTPLYLTEPSPLDPPGMEEARAKMRAERVKEGMFEVGATPEVQQGRAYLLDRNPDFAAENPSGRMVTTATVRVLSCEGTYYFVEAEDGKRGYLRESDMVNPVTLVATSELLPLPGEGLLPDEAGVLPIDDGAAPADGSAPRVRTTETGRTVVIVGTSSGNKSDEFERRKRALENGQSPEGESAAPSGEEEYEDLPEPSGSAGN